MLLLLVEMCLSCTAVCCNMRSVGSCRCGCVCCCSCNVVGVVVVLVAACLPTYLSIYLSIYLSTYLSTYLYLYHSISISLSTSISNLYRYLNLSVHLSPFFQSCKRSYSARLPHFRRSTTSKTIPRDFLQTWKVECKAAGLVPICFAHSICLKYCTCREK